MVTVVLVTGIVPWYHLEMTPAGWLELVEMVMLLLLKLLLLLLLLLLLVLLVAVVVVVVVVGMDVLDLRVMSNDLEGLKSGRGIEAAVAVAAVAVAVVAVAAIVKVATRRGAGCQRVNLLSEIHLLFLLLLLC